MSSASNPLPDTLTPVPGYPSILKLFKSRESRFWQVRCYMGGRMVQKSTKTEEKAPAIKFAKEFYNTLLVKKTQNLPLAESKSFECKRSV